jgi:hypothetical protein
MYDPDILVNDVSLEGQAEPYTQLIDKWQTGAVFLDAGSTFGVSGGAGLRYGLDNVDFVIDARYQYFFSDRIDGLDAPDDPGNLNNDTAIFFNVGVVYVFGKY